MNVDRFRAFRRDSQVIISSNEWLTQQMDEIIDEMRVLPDDCSIEYQEELIDRMDHLQRKAAWEEKEHNKFNEKYKDMLE